jgi:hypothetical protein
VDEADRAVDHAERIAKDQDLAGAAASERAYLAYGATLLAGAERADEAKRAIARARDLLPRSSAHRPLLEFRVGLIAENLEDDRATAERSYRRAHQGAQAAGDELLLSLGEMRDGPEGGPARPWPLGSVMPSGQVWSRSPEPGDAPDRIPRNGRAGQDTSKSANIPMR